MFWQSGSPSRRCVLLLAFLIAIAPVVSYAPNAFAQPRRATAFIYQPSTATLSDDELEKLAVQLGNASKNAIAQANLELAELRLKDALLIVGCDSPTQGCLQRLASSISAEKIFFTQVDKDQNLLKITFNYYESAKKQLRKRELFIRSDESSGAHFYRLVSQWFSEGLPKARLKILTSIPDLTLQVEGNDFGELPQSIDTLSPDRYMMALKKDGKKVWSGQVIVNSYGVSVMRINDGPNGKLKVEVPKAVSPPKKWSRYLIPEESRFHWGAWTLLGAGAAAVAGGGVLGFMVVNKQNMADKLYDQYASGEGDAQVIKERQDKVVKQGKMYATFEFVLFGIGAAAIVAGASWLIYDAVTYKSKLPPAPETVAGLAGAHEENPLTDSNSGGFSWSIMAAPTSLQTKLVW